MKGLYEVMFGTAAVLVVAIWSQAVATTLDMPEVHLSSLTEECVRVINYTESHDYSCQNLPATYNHVWVK
jgi:hypothetical protein